MAAVDGYPSLSGISRTGGGIAVLWRVRRERMGRLVGLGCCGLDVPSWGQWIGWTRSQQWARLRFVVNNARFLILPEVLVPNLALKVITLNTRRLSADWQVVYGHPVVLAETFVDPTRFTDTSYRTAEWQYLGVTQGFARRPHRYVRHGHPKGLWVKPLQPDSQAVLHAPFLSAALTQEALSMPSTKCWCWRWPRS